MIPNSVTEIGDSAFEGCARLTSIEIPDSVTKIGLRAFVYCRGLTNIKVADGNPVYDSRGGCNAIIETESNKLLEGCQSTVIPDSVTEIGESAFHGRTVLTSIEIPDSVTEIGECAFQGCTRLTSVEISDSVTEIGCFAFACCGLTNIVIPDSVTEIGQNAFYLCMLSTNVEIHSPEIELDEEVFGNCKNLKSIKVPAKKADYYKKCLPKELHDLIVEMGECDGNQAKTTKKSYPVFDFALKKIDWELTEDNIEKYREEIDNYGVVVVRALNEDEDFETKVICNGDVADLLYDAMESVEDFENDDWPEVNVYYSTLCEVYGTKEKVWECGEYIFRVLGSYLGDDGYDWGAETGYELLCRVKWLDDDIVNVWKTDKRGDYKDDVDEDMVEEMLEKHSEKSND